MSWTTISKVASPPKKKPDGVFVTITKRSVYLRLGGAVVEATGWTSGQKVQVLQGGGDNAGWLRLDSQDGDRTLSFTGKTPTRSLRMALRLFPGCPEILKPVEVEWIKSGDTTIDFKLPWAAEKVAPVQDSEALPYGDSMGELAPTASKKKVQSNGSVGVPISFYEVVAWMRRHGDTVQFEKENTEAVVNGRSVSFERVLEIANHHRRASGEKPFSVEVLNLT